MSLIYDIIIKAMSTSFAAASGFQCHAGMAKHFLKHSCRKE